MPEGVGYSFLDFELDKAAKELAQMQGLPITPESIQGIKQAIMQNPALGANTPTGKEIAAQGIGDPGVQALVQEDPSFVPADFEAPGAKEALLAYMQRQSPEDAPIDAGMPVDIGPGSFTGEELSGDSNGRSPTNSNRSVRSGRGSVEEGNKQGQQTSNTPRPQRQTQIENVSSSDGGISIFDILPGLVAGGLTTEYAKRRQQNPAAPIGMEQLAQETGNTVQADADPDAPKNPLDDLSTYEESQRRKHKYDDLPIDSADSKPVPLPEDAPIDDPFSMRAYEQLLAKRNLPNQLPKGGDMFLQADMMDLTKLPQEPPLVDTTTKLPTNTTVSGPSNVTPIISNDMAGEQGGNIIEILAREAAAAQSSGQKAKAKAISNILRTLR